jgi:hypothetical protein
MEESCSTGQRPQWAVVPVEEEEEGVPVTVIFTHASREPTDINNCEPLPQKCWTLLV